MPLSAATKMTIGRTRCPIRIQPAPSPEPLQFLCYTRRVPRTSTILLALLALVIAVPSAQRPAVDAAFDEFWAAPSREEAAQRVGPILRSGVSFDEAYRRLQRGRTYGPQPTGVVRLTNISATGVEHHYALNIPDAAAASRRYQVRVQLPGGVGGRATNAPAVTGTVGGLAGGEQIYVLPYAWADSPWW